MKRFILPLCGLAMVSLLAAYAWGADEVKPADAPAAAPAPATPTPPPAADDSKLTKLELMIRETKATDDQQAKLKAKFEAIDKALADWDAQNGPTLTRIEDNIALARNANNSAEVQRLFSEKMALKSDREKLNQTLQRQVMSILTVDQRHAWEGYELYQEMATRFRALKLADDQLAKIREMSGTAATAMAAERDKDGGNPAMVKAKLIKDIHDTVLTDEQRDKLDGKSSGPAPTPASAPAKVDTPAPAPQPPKNTKPPKHGKGTVIGPNGVVSGG